MRIKFKETTKAFTGIMLTAALMLQPMFLSAQDAAAPTTRMNPIGLPDFSKGRPFPEWYRAFEIAAESTANSPRVDQLLKDGKIMLSLTDALMLAIENNVDVAIQRLNAPI